MQKGGNDADDGLIHSQQGGGAGNTGAHGPTTPAPPQSAAPAQVSTLCLQAQQQQSQPQTASPLQPQITPVPQLLLQGGQIQALGGPATIVHQGPTTGSVIRTFPQQSALTAQHLSGALGSSVFLTSTDSSGVQLTTQSITLPSNTSISASGGTIHHHGQSPTRGGLPPLTNTQQTMSGSNVLATGGLQQRQPRDHGVVPSGNAAVNRNLFEGLTKSFAASTAALASGPSPRKRARVEEKPAATPEIANNRKVVLEAKGKELRELKESYIEHLTELFFLQNGGNVMDYFTWKKRPTPQLVHFLKSGNLDSDEEDDHQVQVNIYNDEVKVLTGAGSNIPLATPVAISTTLPPSVTALNQGGRSGVTLSQVQPTQQQSQSIAVTATTIVASTASSAVTPLSVSTTSTYSTDPTITPTGGKPILSPRSPPPNLHTQLAKCIASLNAEKIKTALTTSISGGSPKSRLPFPYRSQKQPIASVYDNTLGSQEAIVERAKQEAQVMQRVADLRKEGMWSSRRLPKVQEPPRNKAHWDYLLEEMQWLAADFAQERKWKKAGARKIARMVAKYHQELHQKEVRAEKEEALKLKRIASQLAKQIKEFWTNIEKVVQYKQQTRLEEKRKKALDLHLNFIVDQTEKYSTWLTEGLTGSTAGSVCSEPLNDQSQISGDEDFQPALEDSDDEETIDIEEKEAGVDEVSTQEEIEALQKESELPIEELIRSLPQGVLSTAASLDGQEEEEVDVEGHEEDEPSKDDEEFRAGSQEEEDMEDTIEEQEKHERSINRRKEMDELQAEGEMSYEDLVAKYAGAYDSDFEFPQDSTDDETDEDDDSEDEEADTEDTEEYEEEEEAEEQTETSPEDVGLEYLMHPEEKVEEDITVKKEGETAGPGKEITDIAAEALSLQPKGYTLQTTEVKTKVPFLLKHTLREYQHVGLNWLATMYEKRLNGILADEMGLGKTIQTIALLAHLACEKGVWGPHLIVVPTSVMLNWEMEIKKWSPAFKILTYYGNQKERKQKRTGWTKTNAFHICITSYKLVIQDHQSFRRKKWKYLILDEAQNIKNFKSQRWQTLLNFSSQRRLLLTGTPLQNSLMELWSLMHFLMPNVFQSHKEFKEWFANPLTGMIEGSHEYNESLIRRLHKVLRPFLLRRLKDDVEKQMPKKYEHVVMCKLSKRQRYLYDDFMSQTKTKETLATGHFMSVINILMQLRKVCNHPNLFDARPIVSPFQMDGIVFRTASMVLRALEYDPFQMMDIHTFFPSLVSMEMDLPAFVAHRVKKLQTPKPLIVEIDSQPDPPPRPKPAKKPVLFRSSSPLVQQPGSGRASPLTVVSQTITKQARPASPVTIVRTTPSVVKHPVSQVMPVPMKLGVTSTLPVQIQKPGIASPVTVASLLQQAALPTAMQFTTAEQFIPRAPTTIATVQATMQTKLPTVQGSAILTTSGSSPGMQSQPITVQIQQTEQGTRLMIPSGQLSQLPAGFIQIVQTSVGQQLITTTNPSTPVQSVVAVQASSTPTANPIVNGVPVATVAASIQPTYSVSMATSTPVLISQPKPSPAVQLPLATTQTIARPVMRVSPLAAEPAKPFTTSVTSISTAGGSALTLKSVREQPKTAPAVVAATKPVVKKPPKPKSEYHMDSLEARRLKCRKDKLDFISKLNKRHCDGKPVYGQDFYKSVNLMQDAEQNKSLDCMWRGQGYVHCYNAQHCKSPHRTDHYLSQTGSLSRVIHTPEQYLDELSDILKRYVFVTPSVMAPTIKLHASHPPPSFLCREEQRKHQLQMELAPKTACLHSTSTKMTVLFPELRLIQYDCGKLQTMDILLRKLKSGDHRVLIFTQMTKMLDVLETFLNYHGHRYLRLDGTTKVEQRQALMERFNADRRIFCFILSTRSGGLGVNLTGADTVIFYDSDWNPTMDAQAQDRCHRIGQTRDVHIYRLISEKTIEENILKKANQKRLLGDLAIEGGSFTTAFFKEATLKDLFEEPSGLDQLAKEKAETKERKEARARSLAATNLPGTPAESKAIVAKFEEALCKAEDETDVIAANQVRAEQKAELAEFDENIPWDEKEERRKDEEEVSKVEMELAMLEKELSPVERYAVCYMESQMEPHNVEELEIAEEEVEVAKNSWELARLKALKEEEERRAEWEDDEMLFTYSRDSAYNQMYISDTNGDEMPMWAPPTPPQDDNDVYIDNTIFFTYEPMAMTETQLPPIYVKKEHIRKPKVEIMSRRLLQKQASSEAAVQFQARKQKQRKEEQPRVPRSLFERPTAAILKLRKEAKLQKLKQGLIKPFRPLPTSSNKPIMDSTPDHPEWLIHEDWALLQAVQTLLDLPLNLMVVSPAHIPNWDLVSDVVNSCSRVYRSPKQCKNRYENVIIAREEGRILYDINPRKQKKSKGIYKTKNNRPMKTSQLFGQDNNNSITMLHSIRFDSVKGIATKRTPTLRPTLVNPTQKNPKHAAVLAESGITYDTPLNPEKVAAIRAERIQLEKKKSQVLVQKAQAEQQLAAQRSLQAAQQQPVTATAVAQVATQLQAVGTTTATTVLQTATLQKTAVSAATIPAVSITRPIGSAASNIIVNTSPGVAGGTFAAINKRMSQQTVNLAQPTTVKTLSPQTVSQAVRAQRAVTGPAMTVQEITAAVSNQAQAQARATLTTSAVVTTAITAAQLAATQRSIAGTSAVTGVSTVQQQLTAAAGKALTPAQLTQLTQLRQQTILKQQALHPRLLAHHTQKITLTEQLRRQQLQKQLQSQQAASQQLAAGQKVIASQLVTTVGQKSAAVKHVTRPLTEADLQALLKRQQALQKQATSGQTVAGQVQQIIAQAPVQQVGQASTSQTQVATLVKTVSAQGMPSVTIPVTQMGPVNINVSMAGAKNPTVSTLSHQQLKQFQLQHQQFKQLQRKALQQGTVTALGQAQVQQLTGKGQMPQGTAIQINRPLPMTVHQIQQLVKQQQQQQQHHGGQAATIQQIITSVAPSHSSQPTLIATVTQAQPQPMVAKVSLATTAPTTQMQTITQATPITLAPASQVAATTQSPVATLSLTAASPQATPTGVVQSVTMTSVGTATVQMQPLPTMSQAKIANLTHTVPRVTHVVHQQVTPGQVTTVGRGHSLTAHSAPMATQQVVVTASSEPQQLQAHIQRSVPTTAILTTQAPVVVTQPTPQPQTVAAIISQAQSPPPPVQAQIQVQSQLTAPPAPPQPLPTRIQLPAPSQPVTLSQPVSHQQTAPQQPPTAPQQPPAVPQQVAAAAPQPQPVTVKTTPYAMRLRNPPKH